MLNASIDVFNSLYSDLLHLRDITNLWPENPGRGAI